jgi:two-component system chemotaxis sensor kinase CheA
VEITSLPQDTGQDAWQMTSPDPVGLLPEDNPAPHPVEPPPATPAPAAPASLRVSLGRVDRLVNLIGELVIMEAMLEQAIVSAGVRNNADIAGSLEGMKQLAANIQETVMSIRAQPLKSVFQRMERITREAAEATGKKVRLQMAGEMTEVDKTVVERLVDPLTHMIRNSVDHGIEATARRQAAHKPEEGVITLSAAHRSGRVLIEVTDDEARGLVPQGAPLTPAEIDNLLFLPGFSSKAEVSALSGRGVGLDVVRREIQALGGRVSIQSTPGEGTSFTIALPLTLAVLEGMLIRVGPETMVLPISVIVETLRLDETQIHDIGQNLRVMFHRGAMIPVINLAHRFGFATSPPQDRRVLILIECDGGRRAALEAEDIQDQRQVVIKSVEENYGTIDGIAAATILGDGKVALIIDPEEIVQSSAMTPPSAPLVVNG